MATSITNYPKQLTMNDFRSLMKKYGGPAKSCRYAVQIVPTGIFLRRFGSIMNDLTYLCEIAEFPGRGLTNVDVRYYGPNQKLPFQTTYEDVNFTFLCRTLSPERQFFDDWINIINPNNSYDFNYRDDYSCRINIYQYANYWTEAPNEHVATYKITMHNAYPLMLSPQPVTWQDEQFQRLQISMTYSHWTRDDEAQQEDYSLVRGRSVTRII